MNRYFTPETFALLTALANNNNRDWFEAHRQEYETTVRAPALTFIGDMADQLAMISPHFLALPKKVGGSLMRVHRDTRFGRDKPGRVGAFFVPTRKLLRDFLHFIIVAGICRILTTGTPLWYTSA